MQITSTSSRLYPAVLPAARRPDAGASSAPNADAVSTSNARSLPPVITPVAANNTLGNGDASRALVLARQRAGLEASAGVVRINQSGNEAAAQRALAEYNTVAAQGPRFESGGVLVGIDVFA